VFFLAVGIAAQQSLGTLVKAFARLLLELPPFEYAPFLILPGITIVIAMIRVPILLPLSILAIGVVSSLYVFWALGWRQGAANPFAWLSAVGLVLAGIQLWRSLQNAVA
jgi:hypothetical protein